MQDVAQLLLERDGGKAGTERLERNLKVLIVEELCVIKTGANNALVAVDNALVVLGLRVRNDDELTRQLAIRIINGEVALVGEHRLADDLMRDSKELLIKDANEHRGPLAEVDDLVKDLFGRIHMGTGTFSFNLRDTIQDDLTATLGGQHAMLLENALVIGRRGDQVLARAQNAMATRGVRAHNVCIAHRNNLIAQTGADPTNGANERSGLGTPALATVVRPFQRGDDALGEGSQNRLSGSRGDEALGKNVLTSVGILSANKIGCVDTALAGKAASGLGGRARFIESDIGRRAALDLVDLLGLGCHVCNDRTEPARRGDDLDIAVCETGIIKALSQKLAILLRGVNERSGGHLLGSDLEQEVFLFRHRFYASFWDEALSAEPPATSAR